MSTYRDARQFGLNHGNAVIWQARGIVDDEIRQPRDTLSEEQLHTVIANAREDISALAMLTADIANRHRRIERLLLVAVVLLI
jgi:hypothetical protein